jgi:thiol-disulfide isomerase/thioredoxin
MTPELTPQRRRLILGATAVAALAAGAGVAWWRTQAQAVDAGAVDALFAATYPDADGRPQPLRQWNGKLLVVNFWATWCAPCVEEMPELQRVHDDFRARGVEVIGLGIDTAPKIRAFRDQLGLRFPLLVAAADGTEIARRLGNPMGALPYTVLISTDSRVLHRKLGRVRDAELRGWLERQLGG